MVEYGERLERLLQVDTNEIIGVGNVTYGTALDVSSISLHASYFMVRR
jgi:hypothetical protein